jgi:hypothetical protein
VLIRDISKIADLLLECGMDEFIQRRVWERWKNELREQVLAIDVVEE